MSHSQNPIQQTLPLEPTDDDYEVITSEEVDRVLDALDQLIASTQSENVRSCLEEAADNIYALIYGEESESGEEEEAA
jgi:hypothetical protein